MGKTTVTNNAGFDIQVKEGNSNIYRVLQVLERGKTMTIKTDGSSTYREFLMILLPDNKKLRPLSSDDIEALDAIEVFKDEVTGDYDWRELPRGAAKKSWFDAFYNRFSLKAGAKSDAEADANAEPSKSTTATQ